MAVRQCAQAAMLSGIFEGGLAQLARAPALQAGGQRFESVILHFSVRMLIGAANQRKFEAGRDL